jgi:hypothetical protein
MKPKTLSGMLDEDVRSGNAPQNMIDIVLWLGRHDMLKCTPLMVEAVGTVQVECGEAVIGTAESGQHITGRTVVLVKEPKQ